MKIQPALFAVVGVFLTATAAGNNFSVTGTGGVFPDGPNGGGTWNVAPSWGAFTSSVSVPNSVTSITTVRLTGLAHTWRGDLQIFLTDPVGVRHNVVVRPGFDGTNSGNSGDYNAGTYLFVESGGGTVAQGSTNINGGVYDQFLNSGGGMWTSGTYIINNTPLNSITGPAGTWILTIVDWFGGDLGSITAWSLEGTDSAGFVGFCNPGGAGILPCPCGNPAAGVGSGCNNFGAFTGGAGILGTGNASLSADTVSLAVTGENNTSLTIIFQGRDPVNSGGVVNGAGIRCVTATLKRLYIGNASAGAITRPTAAGPSVSVRSAALGDPISAGEARHYFSIYRDPGAAGPCGNSASTVNVSNAGTFVWGG
jgi:subtilisin-like proprotein convertase family protein